LKRRSVRLRKRPEEKRKNAYARKRRRKGSVKK